MDKPLCRWTWRGLEFQLALLTSVCLVVSLLGYGLYTAQAQTQSARRTVTAQLAALAQNLATVNAHFLKANEPQQIEALALQTATVDGIYSVLVTDLAGMPITEVVNRNGTWSPRYNLAQVKLPNAAGPDTVLNNSPHQAGQRDFLAGTAGTLSAWHRIKGPEPLGWVRVNYRLDTFNAITHAIRWQALKAIGLALGVTLLLLASLLRPAMRALREATAFASQLDACAGTSLKVSQQTAELALLGQALNAVSARLYGQNLDLNNQKFALDQHAIVSITNLQGSIIYANQRFCEISGYNREELLGQNHRIVKSGEHPPAFYKDLWHTISQGQVWRGDIKNRKKDGGFYWVNATIVPLPGADGSPHQFIGIRTDITANKNLQQSLQFAKQQAEQATLTKGQFLANMSHEIRTPMNAVLGMLRLLHHTPLSERQLDYASKAESAAQSLLGLINDILDFSKMDAGKMTLEARTFRLDKLLRDLSVILSTNVGHKPIDILFDIDPTAPKALTGDALRLHQVLLNLCSNAVKFTAQREVVVSISVLRQSAQNVTLRFAVRDSGMGIAPENQRTIFEGFSQAEASTTRRFGGTGLGLSISRRLVTLMGGELKLQSELGRGSTFAFDITLPIAPEAPAAPGAHVLHSELLGLHVLLVDDNPTARVILSSMLGLLGWEVDVVSGGPEALALLQSRAASDQPRFQVLFLDWHMPGMDGWETLQRLHTLPAALIPATTIMITANCRDTLSQRSAQEQALLQGFLVKPVTASMLFDAVADALTDSTERATDPGTPPRPHKPLHGLRLLVVEDNLINQQVAEEMLKSEGAEVQLAANGQLGVAAVRQALTEGKPFDVVLMDIQMPVMDGYAATRVLRQELGLTQLPIIAMTANAMAADRAACLAAGMNDHVGKPFHLAQLSQRILNPTPLAKPELPTAQTATPNLVPSTTPPTADAAPSAPASGTSLPPVDSVDSAGALDRLGGNQQLYGRVLRAYIAELAALPAQFETQLRASNLVTTERMLHTLKGLSSTVGASYLAEVARLAQLRVWQALDKNQAMDTLSLAEELHTALANTRTVIERVAARYEPPASNATSAPLQTTPNQHAAGTDTALLREWLNLLNASDMRAVAVFDQLHNQALTPNAPAWQKMRKAMDVFDFELATSLGQELLEKEQPPAA